MNNFLDKTLADNTLLSWLYALIFIVASVIVARFLYWIFTYIKGAAEKRKRFNFIYFLIDLMEKPLIFALIIWGIWLGMKKLSFGENFNKGLDQVYYILITINIAWFIGSLFNTFVERYVKPMADVSESHLGRQLLPLLKSTVNIVVWVMAIIFALEHAGYDVSALLAGLGIGGLAFALAAKDTAANVFGGIAVFFDKTFKVGDRIKFKNFDGTITEVGVRVTRLQTFDGTIIAIPNSIFSSNEVENVSEEPSRRVVSNLGLEYGIPVEKVKLALKILKDIVARNKHVDEKVLVSFNALKDYSLNILFIYYIIKGEDILDTQTEINTEILKEFKKKGIEFAFPSQTIYSRKE